MSNKRKAKGNASSPPWLVSPATGDVGFDGHPWIRLNDAAMGFHTPMVMFDLAELTQVGYDPEALGMLQLGKLTATVPVPHIQLGVDMKSRFDVDLYETDSTSDPTFVIGGVFEDPHPDDWWQRIHTSGTPLLLVAGDTPTLAGAAAANMPIDMAALFRASYIGQSAGLVIRAYDSGVGTHPLQP